MLNEQQYEEQIIEMRKQGSSYRAIMDATGCRERYVKSVCKSITKATPFSSCVDAVYALAIREQGCKQYELMACMQEHFGVSWNSKIGKYEHVADEDQRKRIRKAVRDRAEKEEVCAIFVPNWINTNCPVESNTTMLNLALSLQESLEHAVNDFMEKHGINSTDQTQVQQQASSVRREILALAFQGFAPEGVSKRIERNSSVVDELSGTKDVEMQSVTKLAKVEIPEPSNVDHFCDYVEDMGWIQYE